MEPTSAWNRAKWGEGGQIPCLLCHHGLDDQAHAINSQRSQCSTNSCTVSWRTSCKAPLIIASVATFGRGLLGPKRVTPHMVRVRPPSEFPAWVPPARRSTARLTQSVPLQLAETSQFHRRLLDLCFTVTPTAPDSSCRARSAPVQDNCKPYLGAYPPRPELTQTSHSFGLPSNLHVVALAPSAPRQDLTLRPPRGILWTRTVPPPPFGAGQQSLPLRLSVSPPLVLVAGRDPASVVSSSALPSSPPAPTRCLLLIHPPRRAHRTYFLGATDHPHDVLVAYTREVSANFELRSPRSLVAATGYIDFDLPGHSHRLVCVQSSIPLSSWSAPSTFIGVAPPSLLTLASGAPSA